MTTSNLMLELTQVFQDLFDSDLAMQFLVDGHEDGPQTPASMGPDDAEPLAVAGCRADGKGTRSVGIIGVLHCT